MAMASVAGKVYIDDRIPGTVVKIYPREDTQKFKCWGSGVENEKFVERLLPGLGPPVVDLWQDERAEYARLKRLHGSALAIEHISDELLEEAGMVLGRIHSCRNTSWGPLSGKPHFADARQAFCARFRAALRLLAPVDPALADAVAAWSASRLATATWSGEPVLVHGDFGAANLISTRNGIRVIDWEHARWGHPQEDWAKIRFAIRFPEPNGFGTDRGRIRIIERGWKAITQEEPPADPGLTDLLEVYFAICLGVFFQDRSDPRMRWLRKKMEGCAHA